MTRSSTAALDATYRELGAASAKINPVPPKQPKKVQRNIRVSDWLWSQVEEKAAERGVSTSEYVRSVLERAVEKD